MKTLEQWAEHYDIYEMHGTGSGCSYHNLVEWSRPAWEYQHKRIEELEAKLKNDVDVIDMQKLMIREYQDAIAEFVGFQSTTKKISPHDAMLIFKQLTKMKNSKPEPFDENSFPALRARSRELESKLKVCEDQIEKMKSCHTCAHLAPWTEDDPYLACNHKEDNCNGIPCEHWKIKGMKNV
jgi:hypothetical protein